MAEPSSEPAYHEAFEILAFAVAGAALSELISYVLMYRKPEYQRLTASIEKAVRRAPPWPLRARPCSPIRLRRRRTSG